MASAQLTLWRTRFFRLVMGGLPPTLSAVAGAARVKWLALHLDTSGLGVFAQVASAQMWMGTAAGLGLGFPLAREVGARTAVGDEAGIRRSLWTALSLVAIPAAAALVLGLWLAPQISFALLGSDAHAGLVRLSLLGVVGLAFQGPIQGLFAGRSDQRAPVTLIVAGGVASVAATLLLVPRYGIAGGVFGLALLSPAAVASALWFHRRRYHAALLPLPRPPLEALAAQCLLKVAVTGLLLSLLDQGIMIALRAHYLRANGVAANGLVQAALALPQQIGGVFFSYLFGYAFGKISGAGGVEGIRGYTRRQWTPLILTAAGCFAVAMVAAIPLLHLLYSHRFEPAQPMLAWAMLGEFGRVAAQTWALGALPLGGARLWVRTGLSFMLPLPVAYLVFVRLGMAQQTLPYAYASAGLASFAWSGALMTRRGVGIGREGLVVGALSAALLAALAFAVTR